MVGMERSILPKIADEEFHVAAKIIFPLTSFHLKKGQTSFPPGDISCFCVINITIYTRSDK